MYNSLILDHKLAHTHRLAILGTLLAKVLHEIKTPLTCVLMSIELLQRDLPISTDDQHLALARAHEAALKLNALVRDVNLFARDNSPNTNSAVDINKVIESALNIAAIQAPAGTVIQRELGDVPLVKGCESRLGQVALNLFVNAMQAMGDPSVTRRELSVSTAFDGQYVVISISDTGIGMSDDVKQKLMIPFFTTKPAEVGTGLGLPICNSIVEEHGGRLLFESELRKGSTFKVILSKL